VIKKYFFFVLLIFFPVPNIVGQDGWFWQNPLPQGNSLLDVRMLGPNIIAAAGGTGTFMKSSDSGDTWNINHKVNGLDTPFDALFFLDSLTGWAPAGFNVYKTTDAGQSWNP